MKKTALWLIVLCSTLAGCIVIPVDGPWGWGHRGRDYGERGDYRDHHGGDGWHGRGDAGR